MHMIAGEPLVAYGPPRRVLVPPARAQEETMPLCLLGRPGMRGSLCTRYKRVLVLWHSLSALCCPRHKIRPLGSSVVLSNHFHLGCLTSDPMHRAPLDLPGVADHVYDSCL